MQNNETATAARLRAEIPHRVTTPQLPHAHIRQSRKQFPAKETAKPANREINEISEKTRETRAARPAPNCRTPT
jgi:hypothetical protein